MLTDADSIIGHNIIGYDLPVISKLYSWFTNPGTVIDTLLLSRLYHSDMMKLDKKHNWKHMPLKLYGRHSLESYGYRLGEFKGAFGSTTDWKEWSQEMEDYCVQDVTRYNQTMAPLPPLPEWVALEHRVQEILTQQEIHGWKFDTKAAWQLASALHQELREVTETLRRRHPFVAWSRIYS